LFVNLGTLLAALFFASLSAAEEAATDPTPTDEAAKAEVSPPDAPTVQAPAAETPSTEAPTVDAPAEPVAPPVAVPARSRATSTGSFTNDSQAPAAPQRSATPPAAQQSQTAKAKVRRAPAAQDTELNPASHDDVAKEEDDASGGGLFGPIRLGPMVGVGLPNLLSFGGLLKLTRYLGGGINIGLIPTVKISYYGDAKLLYQEYDVFGRLFPFGGGFFLGAGVGYETVKGTLSDKMDTSKFGGALPQGLAIPNPLDYESSGSVRTMVLTPQVGYFYTTSIGFSLGLDIGAQIPIAPSQVSFKSKLILPANTPQAVVDQVHSQLLDPNDKKVRDTLQTIGRAPLPTFNIRIGWLL